MRKFLFYLLSALLFVIALALIIKPEKYVNCALEALSIWALTVLPSLLPFFFLSLLFTKLNAIQKISIFFYKITHFLYGLPGISAFVQLMSFISGYPMGAKLVSELYLEGKISEREAKQISLLSSTSGPMFIIGTVGITMFSSKKAGVLLLLSHYLSAIFNGVIFKSRTKNSPLKDNFLIARKSENILYDCAYGSTISCLVVGTFITVFYVFFHVIEDLKLLTPLLPLLTFLLNDQKKARALLAGLIEFTNGCLIISSTSGFLTLPLTAFIISFGGVSIIVQSLAFLSKAKVKAKTFVFGKLIQGALSFLICGVLQIFFY